MRDVLSRGNDGEGFGYWEPIKASYDAEIGVIESSAAESPHLWVTVRGSCLLSSDPKPRPGISHGVARGAASAHLSMEAARRLRDDLDAAIKRTEERFGAGDG